MMMHAFGASTRRLLASAAATPTSSAAAGHRAFSHSAAAFGARAASAAGWHSLPTPSDPRQQRKQGEQRARNAPGGARAFSASALAAAGAVTPVASAATATAAAPLITAATSTTATAAVSAPAGALLAPLEAADGTLLEPLGWYPQDVLLEAMSFVHDKVDLPWVAVLGTATLILRTAMVPVHVGTMQKTSRMAAAKPELDALIAAQKANPNGDPAKGAKDIRDLYKRYNVNPLATMVVPFLQMPLFMSFFFATRKLADYYPEACAEGALWFTDLGAADPLHILPVIASASFIGTIAINADGQMPTEGPMKNMKYVMYGLGLMTVPIAWTFPAATVFYWCVNNTFSLVQTAVLAIPGVKPKLNILPPPPKVDAAAPPGVGVTPTSFAAMPVRQRNVDGTEKPLEDARPASAVNHKQPPAAGGRKKGGKSRRRRQKAAQKK